MDRLKKTYRPGYIPNNTYFCFQMDGSLRRFKCCADWKESLSNYMSGNTNIWKLPSEKDDGCYLFDNLEYGLGWCGFQISGLHNTEGYLYPILDNSDRNCATEDGGISVEYENPNRRIHGTIVTDAGLLTFVEKV